MARDGKRLFINSQVMRNRKQKTPNICTIYRRFSMFGAGNEIRTRDPNLGKVVLYQLSYSRKRGAHFTNIWAACKHFIH